MKQKRFINSCIFSVCFILMLSFNVNDIQADDSKNTDYLLFPDWKYQGSL